MNRLSRHNGTRVRRCKEADIFFPKCNYFSHLATSISTVMEKFQVIPTGLSQQSGLARGRERHFRTGKRADNLDTTLFRLPVLALPFSPSSSGRHFAGFPVVIKTPRICINCALINDIMLVEMILELISRITRSLSLFYSVNL